MRGRSIWESSSNAVIEKEMAELRRELEKLEYAYEDERNYYVSHFQKRCNELEGAVYDLQQNEQKPKRRTRVTVARGKDKVIVRV